MEDLFFFQCSNIWDRDNMVDVGVSCYQGALMVHHCGKYDLYFFSFVEPIDSQELQAS